MNGVGRLEPAQAAGGRSFVAALSASMRLALALALAGGIAIGMAGCGSGNGQKLGERVVPLGQPVPKGGGRYHVGKPYEIAGTRYEPREDSGYNRVGKASWYGELFHGRRTANGEIYDMDRLTAAHPTLPLPVYARVTNLNNGRTIVVRINDRGPYAHDRIIDLSRRSAEMLGFRSSGEAVVRVQYMARAPLNGDDAYERRYLASQSWMQVAGKRKGRPQIVSLAEETELGAATPEARKKAAPPAKQTAAAWRVGTPPSEPARAAPETTGSIAAPFKRGDLLIQAGAFKVKENAHRAHTTLGEIGAVEVDEIEMKGDIFFRVRVGPFRDRRKAKAALSEVTKAGFEGARIVKN